MPSEPGRSVGSPPRCRRSQYSWNQPTWPISQIGGSTKCAGAPSICSSVSPSRSCISTLRASSSKSAREAAVGSVIGRGIVSRGGLTAWKAPGSVGDARRCSIATQEVTMTPRLLNVFAGSLVLAALAGSASGQQPPTFETRKVADNVYVFRHVGHQAMFVVTADGVIATDPISPAAARAYVEETNKATSA